MPPFLQARRADPSPRAGVMSTFALGPMRVRRSGYGAMQLAGPFAFGPPPDRASAIGVLRAAVAAGVDHIDTAQYYGPGVVNDLIREALYPIPTGWPSSARSRSGQTTAAPSSRPAIRTGCATTSTTTCAPCGPGSSPR
jgi:Aldo/keto reductase family